MGEWVLKEDLFVLETDGLEVSCVGDLLSASSDFLPVVRHTCESIELGTKTHS